MKKLLCILLALVMAVSMLTACGQKNEPENTPATEPEKNDAPTTAEPAPEASGDDVGFDKLDIVAFTGGYGDMWSELLALFQEKYPNVEIVSDLGSDVETRVRTRMMTETPPDIVFISGSNEYDIYEAANSGMLYDLSDWFANGVNADGDKMTDVLSPARLAPGTMNGAVYLPTILTGYAGWWYNAALFREKGWEVPTSYEELDALSEKIQAEGIIPLMYQAVNYAIWGYMYEAIAAAGGYDAYADCFINLKEGAWTSDAALEAVTQMSKLVADGTLSKNSVAVEFTQAQIDFVNDRVAMIPCGTWFENEMKESTPEGFEMTFMPFPAKDSNGVQYITAFDTTIAVPAECKNPEAAKAFLGIIYSVEGQKIVTKYGALPVTNTCTTDDIAEYMTPTMESAVEGAASGKIGFVSNNPEQWYAPMWPTLQACIADLVLEEITPEEFCQKMEAAAAAIREDDTIVKFSTN